MAHRGYLKIQTEDPRLARFAAKLTDYELSIIAQEITGKALKELDAAQSRAFEQLLDYVDGKSARRAGTRREISAGDLSLGCKILLRRQRRPVRVTGEPWLFRDRQRPSSKRPGTRSKSTDDKARHATSSF